MWRFRKSFSPLPGVRISLSPSGISTSVGAGPFRVTAGPSGPHLTTNVFGTGLSHRQALFGTHSPPDRSPAPAPTPQLPTQDLRPTAAYPVTQIQSAGSAALTTPGLTEFRKLIDRARKELADTTAELTAAQSAEQAAVNEHLSWKNGWLLRRVMKARFAQLAAKAEEAVARRVELDEQLTLARLDTQIDLSEPLKGAYSRLSDTFVQLSRATQIWDTISHRETNQFAERTTATRSIERKPVRFRPASAMSSPQIGKSRTLKTQTAEISSSSQRSSSISLAKAALHCLSTAKSNFSSRPRDFMRTKRFRKTPRWWERPGPRPTKMEAVIFALRTTTRFRLHGTGCCRFDQELA